MVDVNHHVILQYSTFVQFQKYVFHTINTSMSSFLGWSLIPAK